MKRSMEAPFLSLIARKIRLLNPIASVLTDQNNVSYIHLYTYSIDCRSLDVLNVTHDFNRRYQIFCVDSMRSVIALLRFSPLNKKFKQNKNN